VNKLVLVLQKVVGVQEAAVSPKAINQCKYQQKKLLSISC